MKELKNLTERERINISVKCEPFFLVANQHKVFNNIHYEIKSKLKLSKKYDTELWLILTSLIKAVKYGQEGTRFSLNKQHFVTANKIHKQKLSLDRTRFLIDKMEESGYIDFFKGFKISDTLRMTSCLLIKESFSKMITVGLARKFGMKRDPLSYIEIKDKDDKKVFLSIYDFRGAVAITKFMEKYNNLLSKSIIMMPDEETGEMLKCMTVYKRVFSGDLEGAGRLYAMGKFQVMKSKYRKFMTIDGVSTTEVDYSNLHPRMLYTLEGVVLPSGWDAYKIPELEWVCGDEKRLRTFIKESYLAILFSEDRCEAEMSVLQKANKSEHININSRLLSAKVVDAVLDKNTPIRHHFFEERLWAKLQNMDSKLATNIIRKHTEEDKVCLGWHDSFCVAKQDREFLIETMKSAWFSLFGTYSNFKYDIEY